jgi:UDP-glucose 4-epimerase
MSVWITGANGFIGRYLIGELAGAGDAVHGVGHGAFAESDRRRLGLKTWINGEIEAANLNALAAMHGPPSKVFHLAGGSSVGLSIELPLEDFSRTVASTGRLLEWLRNSAPDCLLVVASSAAVYGANHVEPISEDGALRSSQADDGATVQELRAELRHIQRDRATVFGLWRESS